MTHVGRWLSVNRAPELRLCYRGECLAKSCCSVFEIECMLRVLFTSKTALDVLVCCGKILVLQWYLESKSITTIY